MKIRSYMYKFKHSFYFMLRNKQLFIKQYILLFLFYLFFIFFFKFYNYLNMTYSYYISTSSETSAEDLVNTLPALIGLIGIVKLGLLIFTIGIFVGGIFISTTYWVKIFKIFELNIKKKIELGLTTFTISFEFLAFDFLFNILLGFLSIPIASWFLKNIVKFSIWLLPVEDILDIKLLTINTYDILSIVFINLIIYIINLISLRLITKKTNNICF